MYNFLRCIILCVSLISLSACAPQRKAENFRPQLEITAHWTDYEKTVIKVKCEYIWSEAPNERYQDPYSVSWNEEEFRSIPGSIYRNDCYGNNVIYYEDHVASDASNGKYENYAVLPPTELCKEGPIYGEMSFLVEPVSLSDDVLNLMCVYEHVIGDNEHITTTIQKSIYLQ